MDRRLRTFRLSRLKKESRKRERGSESRSRHHECCRHSRPPSPHPSSTLLRLTTTLLLPLTFLLFSVHRTPRTLRHGVHVLNADQPRSKNTKRCLGYVQVSRTIHTNHCERELGSTLKNRDAARSRMSNPCCLILLKPSDAPRGSGKSIGRLWSIPSANSVV